VGKKDGTARRSSVKIVVLLVLMLQLLHVLS
jgi:hypothetical protein